MNLPLSDPVLLAQDIPEVLIHPPLRSSGQAVCIRFSHRGDLLAAGTAKGAIAIFDLETNGVARKLGVGDVALHAAYPQPAGQ